MFFDRFDCHFQVTNVIHRVEHPENVHAIHGRTLYKPIHNVIGIMSITQNVLSPEQHLLARIGHRFLELAYSLPGILTQVTNTGVECGATPGLDCPEANPVQFVCDRQHVIQSHPGRQQGLMGVTQDDVGYRKRLAGVAH